MTNTIYKPLESCKTAKVILDKLDDSFRGKAALAQQSAMVRLMNAQHKCGILIKYHMITLMGYFCNTPTCSNHQIWYGVSTEPGYRSY
ncbi:hypothetical protein PVK06_004745 [Gossypium arboreum]|uniref:Uncharacterized protein n=1 Tax=Gossypium arboreum TaxID=29729 RepID=A0ABR0QST5_GOSAR|nr:hypothetical protein PVK06_004745 [Gossypium arboreum]